MFNKKAALLFAPILVVFMVFGLIYAWSAISGKYNAFNRDIGEKQFDLINTYQLGEGALFYIDQSAEYSAYQTIYDLAKAGGCDGESVYSDYTLWDLTNPDSDKCNPNEISSKNTFTNNLQNNLNFYLEIYNPIQMILDNYDFIFDNNILIGKAKNELEIPILQSKARLESPGTYSIKPSFKVGIDYDFSDYDELRVKAEELIERCDNKDSKACIDENKFDIFNEGKFELFECGTPDKFFELAGFLWESETRFRVYGFCIKDTEKRFYTYDVVDKKVSSRNIIYKFALRFEDIACYLDEDDPIITQCKEFPCDEYLSCNNMDTFPGTSEPLYCYCSNPAEGPDGLNSCKGRCPDCECTSWGAGECGGEVIGEIKCGSDQRLETRECRHVTCGLPESQCVFDACCADPICCGDYPPSCDCEGEVCCSEDDSLCEPTPEPVPMPPSSG